MANQPLSKKPLFNLSKVLQETGIKADTLRAWERRYQLPMPSRTEGGHRLFSAYDIETIKWLQARQDEGLRISQAVDYWRELIDAGTDPLAEQTQRSIIEPAPTAVGASRKPLSELSRLFIDYALDFDEKNAEQVLDQAFSHFPWEVVCTNLISQGLAEIGELWYTGEITVQQEHFTSELVIKKLQALTAGAPAPYHPQKVLISNPPGEFHTIAPLMINMLLRYRGWEVSYLGANVPDDQLEKALEKVQPSLVIMTAARLTTAAALLQTSQVLQNQGIPLAFGGPVFTSTPKLAERIPGTYLNTDLGQVISQIESLLSAPDQAIVKSTPPNQYLNLWKEFKEKVPYLENQALLSILDNGDADFTNGILQDATNLLFQDILAALALGDLQYLRPTFEWTKGLMNNRDYQLQQFKHYLQSFTDITEEKMSGQAQPLIEWLKEFREALD
jgi:methanogenic corrinoid protein MtbC1